MLVQATVAGLSGTALAFVRGTAETAHSPELIPF